MNVSLAQAGIVAHDAGGAELIASLLRRHGVETPVCTLGGPAQAIFGRKLPLADVVPLPELVASGTWFLCGTGWQSHLEFDAISAARRAGKRTVAFLDHWVNYHERFVRDGILCVPDELWVTDDAARARALQDLPGVPVSVIGNPYFEEQIEAMTQRSSGPEASAGRLLFLDEPVARHALAQHGDERHWGYTEFDAFDFLQATVPDAAPHVHTIVVRPHPAEPAEKYRRQWRDRGDVLVVPSTGGDLVDDLSQAEIVAGCNSMGMALALAAGKRVFSAIPPGGRRCVLPHAGIESLIGLGRDAHRMTGRR